ncbi:MAG: 5'/3'-nucleotidase SurE, partial [Chloroflexota bacterium]
MTVKPLILLTNDDGIDSPGLHAVAEAVADLGELLIMAPSTQQTGAGRSYPVMTDKNIYKVEVPFHGEHHQAYMVAGSPAQSVAMALSQVAERPVDLCISGINYGENIGSGVTISGTVGAAIEAACSGIPAMAVSLETPKEYHLSHSDEIDFTVAAHFARIFTQKLLQKGLPKHVDLIKVDVPAVATPETPWQITSVSRQRYYELVHGDKKPESE